MCYQYYRRMLLRFGQQLIAYSAAVFIVTVVVAISPHLRIKSKQTRFFRRFFPNGFGESSFRPVLQVFVMLKQSNLWQGTQSYPVLIQTPCWRGSGRPGFGTHHTNVQLDDDHVYWPIASLRRWLPQPRGCFWISCSCSKWRSPSFFPSVSRPATSRVPLSRWDVEHRRVNPHVMCRVSTYWHISKLLFFCEVAINRSRVKILIAWYTQYYIWCTVHCMFFNDIVFIIYRIL